MPFKWPYTHLKLDQTQWIIRYVPTFAAKSITGALEFIAPDKVEIRDIDDAKIDDDPPTKPEQLWIKDILAYEGYFTFKSFASQKFLTAVDQIQIEGK